MSRTPAALAAALLFAAGGALAQSTGNATANGATSTAGVTNTTTSDSRDQSDRSLNRRSGAADANASRSAALNNGATGSFPDAFNVSSATAITSLSGTVTGNTVCTPPWKMSSRNCVHNCRRSQPATTTAISSSGAFQAWVKCGRRD